VDPAYGARYRELFERHWWWRAREAVILHELRRLRPDGRWGSILDVGCGDGLFLPTLARFGVPEGVEADADLVSRRTRERFTVHLRPFGPDFVPAHPYRLVLFLDVIEHLDDPVAALAHAASLLEPDGCILVTVPAFPALWTRHDVINHHRRRYTRTLLAAQAAEAGLRLQRARYFFHWVAAAKLLVRALERVRGGSEDPLPAVPPAPVNRALTALSLVEHRLLGPLRLPFGSSLLGVLTA